MRRGTQLAAATLFLLPSFAGFAVFVLTPLVFSLLVSFSNWNLMQGVEMQWTGLENYGRLLEDEQFWLYFINTIYLMLGLPVSIAAALFIAILLNQPLRGMVAYRTLYYLPSITAGVAVFILWKALFNPTFGPVNLVLDALLSPLRALPGLDGLRPPEWLGSTRNLLALAPEGIGLGSRHFGIGARDAIILMGIWMAMGGANMLLYLAGLSNIPQELYEAAEIDGAGRWARFRHITWPQLAPTTFFIVVMNFIAGLQGGFEQARIMTEGGPAGTTMTLSYYIFNLAFEEFQIGYASAVAWVLFLLIFAVTFLNWRYGGRHAAE